MARYAGLVEYALRQPSNPSRQWEVCKLHVAIPFRLPAWLPGNIETWLNHLWIAQTSGRRISRAKVDLVHVLDGSYGYLISGVRKLPVVVTVHDLIPILQQQGRFENGNTSFLARRTIAKSIMGLQRSDRLMTVSENSFNDLVDFVGIDEEKITVVPNALDRKLVYAANSRLENTAEAKNDATPYVFHIGNNAEYKNRQGVVRIFSNIATRLKVELVMAGPPPSAELAKLVTDLDLESLVDFVENPDDNHLFKLYQEASLFLFPSIYEGFGWPPLEAMAFGCPVVSSSEASLPEVVGDAALQAAAKDEQQLADHCIAVLQNPELARSLSEKGRIRAGQFTVERMGREIAEVYARAMEGQPSLS